MPRQSDKPRRIQMPTRSPLEGFPDVPPLSPLSRDAIFNRNGSATYGIGGSSLIRSAISELASEGIKVEWNCDDVRAMVRKFIKNGDMKVVELHRTLHVSPKSYYPFMKQKGTHAGLENVMYKKLNRFFLDREEAGLWVPQSYDIEGDEDEENGDTDSDHNEAEIDVVSIDSDGDNDLESDKENGSEATHETTRYNCDQVRYEITRRIEDEGLIVDDFIHRLGVSLKSFQSFTRQRGPHSGVRNPTYKAAHEFFVGDQATGALRKPTKSRGKKASTAKTASTSDISSLPFLPGEDKGTVPVYASCSDIRDQIITHLHRPGVTQASLCRALSACQGSRPDRFHSEGHSGPLQSVQLQKFLQKKGHMAGNTSKAFYTAYVYFEKLRLKEGKEKTEKRLYMEKIWGAEGGVDTKTVSENIACVMTADAQG